MFKKIGNIKVSKQQETQNLFKADAKIPAYQVYKCPKDLKLKNLFSNDELNDTIQIMLESGISREDSRYSIAAYQPKLVDFHHSHNLDSSHITKSLRSKISKTHSCYDPTLPPFTGGHMGVLSYEAYEFFHPDWTKPKPCKHFPQTILFQVDHCFVLDHKLGLLYLITNSTKPNERCQNIQKMSYFIDSYSSNDHQQDLQSIAPHAGKVSSSMDQDTYCSGVKLVKECIQDGITYQANLAQQIEVETHIDSTDYYRKLTHINPSPFSGFMHVKGFTLLSASPERLISCNSNNQLTMRPIAGTRKRGKTLAEDLKMTEELKTNPKERAEHAMLVDLVRNDLSKVSKPGSVKITKCMEISKYSHVMHLESVATSQRLEHVDNWDVIGSAFPGGTITGVPKRSTVNTLNTLEKSARGPYTGGLGYFSYNGCFDLNILIRSVSHSEGKFTIGVGAGIVFDSQPTQEYKETMNKARAQLVALGVEQKGFGHLKQQGARL